MVPDHLLLDVFGDTPGLAFLTDCVTLSAQLIVLGTLKGYAVRILISCFIGIFLLFSWSPADAQVTNITVNGSASNFSMASGDVANWEFDIPSGQGGLVAIWFDLNDNGVVDAGTDKLFAQFTQIDGDTVGGNGPPDMDGAVNGHVSFNQNVGLAPGKYILSFTHNSVGGSVLGTVTPLLLPNGTISGTVTPPSGKGKQNIVVEASQRSDTSSQGGGDGMFWDALTDANGSYTINIHTDAPTTFWRVRVLDNFAPSIASPAQAVVVLETSLSGIDFSYLTPAAQVTGFVYDENSTPLPFVDLYIRPDSGNNNGNTQTDQNGFFQIGLQAGVLNSQGWHLETFQNGYFTTTELQATRYLPAIHAGDSLHTTLIVYSANSQIEGDVRVNGSAPGFPAYVEALSSDTAKANVYSDSVTGHFIVPVSDKLSGYTLNILNLPLNHSFAPVAAQAGETGKILNLIFLSVVERRSGIPTGFALRQNYPNPFNPLTAIQYDLPKASYVTLVVYSVLGEEVGRLWDGEQGPGAYTARFDASTLPSGVYFYRLTAGQSVAMQQMILMK